MTRSRKCSERATWRSRVRGDLSPILFLDYSVYEQPGFEGAKYVMTPPIREKWNQEKLWAVADERPAGRLDRSLPVLLQEQKELGKSDFSKIPNGGPGVENRMSLVYNGGVAGAGSASTVSSRLPPPPRRRSSDSFAKGTIAVGSDADIVISIRTKR